MKAPRWVECSSGRVVVVETGADGWDGIVTYRYEDERTFRTMTRERAFLCGYFVAAADAAMTVAGSSQLSVS